MEEKIVIIIIGGVVTYLIQQARVLRKKLEDTMTKDEIKEHVKLKIEPHEVETKGVTNRLNRLEAKIDKLIALLRKP